LNLLSNRRLYGMDRMDEEVCVGMMNIRDGLDEYK
jgi:hypothetical protein